MRSHCRTCLGALVVLLLILVAGSQYCPAQLDTGNIAGVVLDASGAAIPGASVKITNLKTGRTWEAKTGAIGEYTVPSLPPGTYKVEVSSHGFRSQVMSGVVLHSTETARADFKLAVGAVAEQLTVAADALAVNTTTSDTGGVITTKMVQNLPLNGRNFYDLIALTPGADATQAGAVNGTETLLRGMNILLDGTDATRVDTNSFTDNNGRSISRITRASVDSIQEVHILSSNYSAEYGRAEGAIIDIITKSGDNEFHGSVFEFLRNDYMDAQNYFAQKNLPSPLRMNQFGGNIGGPIKKKKLFFFFNYEGVREIITQDQLPAMVYNAQMRALAVPAVLPIIDAIPKGNLGAAPTAVNTSTDPNTGIKTTTTIPYGNWFDYYAYQQWTRNNENTGSLKIDWTVTPKDTLALRYNFNNGVTTQKYGPTAAEIDEAPNRVQLGKLTWNHSFSPTFLNEVGLTINRPRTNSYNYGGAFPSLGCFFCDIGFGALPGPGFLQFTVHMPNQSVQLIDLATKIVGQHQIKFGFDIRNRRQRNDLVPSDSLTFGNGTLAKDCHNTSPTNVDCRYTGAPDGLLTNSGLAWSRSGYPMTAFYNTDYSFFVNDDFRVTRRLTLNLGLRYDYSTVVHDPHSAVPNFDLATLTLLDPSLPLYHAPKTDFGPRLGFNFDLLGDGTTTLRGGAGIFYLPGVTNLSGLAGNMNQNFSVNLFQTEAFFGGTIQCKPPVTYTYPPPATVPNCNLPKSITFWDRNPHDTHTAQWNVSLQRQVRKNLILDVGYVGIRGIDVYSLGETNPQITSARDGAHRLVSDSYASIQRNGNFAESWYHAFQTSLRGNIGSLLLNFNYTWGHETDNASGFWGNYQNIYDLGHEWASGDSDVRHLLNASFIYSIPSLQQVMPFTPKKLAEGWQVAGMVQYHTGYPVDITNGGESIAGSRPNCTPGVPIATGIFPGTTAPDPNDPTKLHTQFNPGALKQLGWGEYGNCPRNPVRGPGFFQPDFSLSKSTKVGERATFELKGELFNFINHPNFAAPGAQMSGLFGFLFGVSARTVNQFVGLGTSRQFQVSARVNF